MQVEIQKNCCVIVQIYTTPKRCIHRSRVFICRNNFNVSQSIAVYNHLEMYGNMHISKKKSLTAKYGTSWVRSSIKMIPPSYPVVVKSLLHIHQSFSIIMTVPDNHTGVITREMIINNAHSASYNCGCNYPPPPVWTHDDRILLKIMTTTLTVTLTIREMKVVCDPGSE